MQSLFVEFRRAWNLDAPFLRVASGRTCSYGDLERLTGDLSLRLQGAGLALGERVVSVVERSEWNIFLYLACVRAGVIYVPLNPRLTPAELSPIIADADPALVVCEPELEVTLTALLPPRRARMCTLDASGHGTLMEQRHAEGHPDVELPAGHPAAIIFTSGTTGRPKGALLPHELFVGKARSLGSAVGYTAQDRLLHTLPLYHAHGLFMTLHCVLNAGASILLLPKFEAREVVARMPEATVFSGVPTMYKRLLEEPGLGEAAAGMRLFISGSAALPPEVFEAFEERAGHRILECWGMSETMTNTANPLNGERRPGSVGKALPGVTVRAVDELGQVVSRGVPGTLQVGFTTSFGGYWRRPPSEQPAIRDGHMATGDIGVFDHDGYLTIVGRTSEAIISGGYNVYPREVEIALEELREVARAAVFAVRHPDLGEAVAAAVETAPGTQVDPADIMRKLRSRLVNYKVPKAVFVEDTLPLTELGKIQRAVLARKYADHFIR